MQAEGTDGEHNWVQTVLQSHGSSGSGGRGSEEEVLTSCFTKATLDRVVSFMCSSGSPFMCMAAATAMQKGMKLKAYVGSRGAAVPYLLSALACTWSALARGTAKPTLQHTENQQPLT